MRSTTRILFLLLVWPFLLFSFGCETSSTADNQTAKEEENSRSILDESTEEDKANISTQPSFDPQLMGTWQLTERKMGLQTLAMADNEESLLEFKEDGTLILTADGFEPATYDFTLENGTLTSDLWDQVQEIKTLSQDQLVLVDKVDGVDIDYIYTKVK